MGEDCGEGSSITQERSDAFAMKSQLWLLDPRPNLPSIVRMVEHGFGLSEASNMPVMLEVRIRGYHVYAVYHQGQRLRPFSLTQGTEYAAPGHRHHCLAAGQLRAWAGQDRALLARGVDYI